MVWLFALAAVSAGCVVVGGLVAPYVEHSGWPLGVGLGASVGAPGLLAAGLRRWRRRRRNRDSPHRPLEPIRHPRLSHTLLLVNLAMLLTLAWVAPLRVESAVRRHGREWLYAWASRLDPSGPPERRTEKDRPSAGSSLRPDAARPSDPPTDPGEAGAAPPDAAPAESPGATAVGGPPQEGTAEVRFETEGSSILVPVELRGPRGTVAVRMIFDTGATLTTLDRPTMDRLGLNVESDAEAVEVHTANGTVRGRPGLLDGASVGAARLGRPLAFFRCDRCAAGASRGLLGLNFARNFRVTVDHEDGRLILAPRSPSPDHAYDARFFVRFDERMSTQREGETLRASLRVHNLGPRGLRGVRVLARRGRFELVGELGRLPPHSVRALTLSGRIEASDGARFELQLQRAYFGRPER